MVHNAEKGEVNNIGPKGEEAVFMHPLNLNVRDILLFLKYNHFTAFRGCTKKIQIIYKCE